MIELVTLEQVKAYVQQTASHDDEKLRLLLRAASRMVLRYLKVPDSVYQNNDGTLEFSSDGQWLLLDADGKPLFFRDGVVTDDVQAAVLYLVAVLYRDPDGVESDKWTPGYLPAPVVSMLYSMRVPTIA